MVNVNAVKSIILSICLLITTSTFAQKSKKKSEKKVDKERMLDGKNFDVQFTEKKSTGLSKPILSSITMKSGKVQCDLMKEKLDAQPMIYKITLDTTYFVDEDSVHKIGFRADFSEDKIGYKWEATITDYTIEGIFIQTRSGVEKKRFEFEGEEKTKK